MWGLKMEMCIVLVAKTPSSGWWKELETVNADNLKCLTLKEKFAKWKQ